MEDTVELENGKSTSFLRQGSSLNSTQNRCWLRRRKRLCCHWVVLVSILVPTATIFFVIGKYSYTWTNVVTTRQDNEKVLNSSTNIQSTIRIRTEKKGMSSSIKPKTTTSSTSSDITPSKIVTSSKTTKSEKPYCSVASLKPLRFQKKGPGRAITYGQDDGIVSKDVRIERGLVRFLHKGKYLIFVKVFINAPKVSSKEKQEPHSPLHYQINSSVNGRMISTAATEYGGTIEDTFLHSFEKGDALRISVNTGDWSSEQNLNSLLIHCIR